ncbi:alpha-mannosidase I MNS5-like isoform X3 [Zingiber officinale]|uniref:alpha-mannosidase I MNS5-like isoform X3 n=1 Tax=Zingiber officinale TaxID=94328 RepID=UPI001C4DBEC1|nr:alpha-mannosidase I MNS5-like isoform X3 [Zingiber officinale]
MPCFRSSTAPLRRLFVLLLLLPASFAPAVGFGSAKRMYMREKVRNMFYHAYENYMAYAFPHDELKPLTKTYTDSLSELGNLKLEHLPHYYNGSALTLVESLSSLLVLGNYTEFEKGVLWLSDNLTFDVDARVNLFEYGVMEEETTETSTSGCGSLILEMGALSRLTGNPRFEAVALRALRKLWSMRSSLNLLGTTLDVITGEWIEYSTGIGAGVDSFYEYLMKAYVIFGNDEFWDMFHSAYLAVQKYFRHGPWYHEADMRTGKATYWQLTSLQAFWPGLQILVGDISSANSSHREFFHVWEKFGVLPERYLLDHNMLHPTEKYYPLRPELAESTFYLYQATKDPWYMEVGERMIDSLNFYARVDGGFASIRDVSTMQLEDHQHSFFLSETCKYLYLLYDDSFLADQNYVFTTEGHPLPIRSSWHDRLPEAFIPRNWTSVKVGNQATRASALSQQVCPATTGLRDSQQIESACHVPDLHVDHRCRMDDECGIDSTTCRNRDCSMAGYCGLWSFTR